MAVRFTEALLQWHLLQRLGPLQEMAERRELAKGIVALLRVGGRFPL